ncbi:MAG: universal stress protein [Deltaproteobacteria bacterium]|jgi:universal stress protein A
MTIKRITCCVDFSENARFAFQRAVELAEKFQAKLYVIHVLPPAVNPLETGADWVMPEEPKKSLILKIQDKMAQEYGSKIAKHMDSELLVLDGHVSSEIIRFLEENEIDLVVLGSYGASGMGLVLFGSVANRVAHKAPCSVMIVRSEDKVT